MSDDRKRGSLELLLRNLHRRSNALAALEEVYDALFGADAPTDDAARQELAKKMREAIDALRLH